MKKYILFLLIAFISLPTLAQKKQHKFSEDEFRSKKEAYITEKAELTPEEAAQFFPLYFELQELKAENNRKAWAKGKEGLNSETTEKEYEEIFNAFFDADKNNSLLDKEYMKKCQRFLSNKKIYKALKAEILFSRHMLKIMQKQEDKNK